MPHEPGEHLLALEKYIGLLQKVKKEMDSGDSDSLLKSFDSARRYRDTSIDVSSGPIKSSNTIHAEIPDEPGALAVVMVVLVFHGIDIKNVGIVHNREVETGSLRVGLCNENAVRKACDLLISKDTTPWSDDPEPNDREDVETLSQLTLGHQ